MHFRVFYSICGDNPKMYGDKIKGQAPIKLNEWNHKRGNDRNAIPFHNIRFIRRLRNATSRMNTAFFCYEKQITPHWIWYNRVD